jgi:hypothetical protein
MRTVRLSLLALTALALLTSPASAKEGVRAKLEGTARLDAAAGTKLRVAWRLVDAGGRPFGASGIYLRVARCAGGVRRVPARSRGRGRFSARVVVPQGGIRELRVGLVGWRIPRGGKAQRADRLFAFDPPLVRRCG